MPAQGSNKLSYRVELNGVHTIFNANVKQESFKPLNAHPPPLTRWGNRILVFRLRGRRSNHYSNVLVVSNQQLVCSLVN